MTVKMAVNPQVRAGTGSTPARTAGARGAKSVPPAAAVPPAPAPSRRRGFTPLTPMRHQAAKSMSRLADQVQQAHPDLAVHQHVRDAARMLRSGNEEAAQRHLRAAIFSLTPQSLMRQGVHDDTGHIAARQAMHGVHRHLLLVKDIVDVAAKNQAAIRRDSYGDYESGPSLPSSPVHADPNAGYGPGALAQKPTARQPGGDRALNAPDRTNSGGSDPAVADPVGPQPKGSKQFAYGWDDLAAVVFDLSAETGRLAVTPAPYGKPGGPGLYGVKGNKHSDYFEHIVQALMRRGMGKGKASAIAWGSIRRWGAKSKHPEVRAAAIGAQAEEKVAQARAHAHAVTWDDLASVIEMVGPEGFIHGYVFVGVPGSADHAKALQDLASHVDQVHKGTGAGDELRAAADSMEHGDKAATGGHLKTAYQKITADPQYRQGVAHDSFHQAAAENLNAVRQHLQKLNGWQPPAASASLSWDDLASVTELAAATPAPDAHQQHVAHLRHLAGHGTAAQQKAAKAALAKMAGKSPAKSANATAQPRVGAGVPAGGQFAPPGSGGSSGKAPAKSKTAAKPATSKATTSKAAPGGTAKASSSKTASTTAKAAHAAHVAHVAHLQHLATHGNPEQKKAATAILGRLGVKA